MRKNVIFLVAALLFYTGTCIAQKDTVMNGKRYYFIPASDLKKYGNNSTGRFSNTMNARDSSGTGNSIVEGDPNDGKDGASNANLPVVVLPSPDNVGLVRGVSEDVDLYTGKLNVSIPVYTAKGRSIEIPITVQMNAGAQKVNDIGSWVGLGNHLNTGGSITRVMKNLPDEFSENVTGDRNISPSFNFPGVGYLSIKNSQYGSVRLERFGTPPPPMVEYTPGEKRDIILKGSWAVKKNGPDKGFDLQPDEFYFNFGKYSGKFTFDQDGNIIFSSEANLKITPTISNGKITNFVVLTDDGYKYEFGGFNLNAVEESQQLNFSRSILFTYLPAGDNQNFLCVSNNGTYNGPDLLGTGNVSIPGEYLYKYLDFNLVMAWDLPQTVCATNPYCIQVPTHLMDFTDPPNTYFADFPFYPSTWYLTKITSPVEETASFNYVDNGQLNYLSNRSFNSNTPIPTTYGSGYSFASGCNSTLNSFAAPREFLPVPISHYPSFGEKSISATQIKVNSKRISSIDLADGSKIRFFSTTNRTDLIGDKRLDKITVEKDGTTYKEFHFDYETVQSTEASESKVYTYRRADYVILPGVGNAQFYGLAIPVNDNMSSIQTGTYLELDAGVKKRMYLKSITEKGQISTSLPPYTFEYYNQPDLSFRTSVNQDVYGYTKTPGVPSSILPPIEKLKAGVLKKIAYPTGGYKEYVYEVSGNSISWNGLRISQIRELESGTATPILKNYSYGLYTPTDRGDLFYRLPDVVDIYNNKAITLMEKGFSSETNRVNPESETRGAVGGYNYTEVSQPGNGKSRVEFTTGTTYPDTGVPSFFATNFNGGTNANLSNVGYYFPYPHQISNDWQRGLPIAEYVKNESGTELSSKIYEYDFSSFANGTGYSPAVQASRYQPYSAVPNGWTWALYGHYLHYPKWRILKKTTERTYDQAGGNYSELSTEYTNNKFTYNNRDYMYPVTVKTTSTSRNEVMVAKTKYPFEYTATDDFGLGITYLKTKNVLGAPVEQYSYIETPAGTNARYISGVLNKYHTDKPLVKEVFKLKTNGLLTSFTPSTSSGGVFVKDANYKSEMQFPVYDAYGHILQQNKTNDISEAYKWGYNNMFPVAKAVNATAAEIEHTSFEPGDGFFGTNSINQPASAVTGNYIRKMIYQQNFNFGTIPANKEYKLTFWQTGSSPALLRVVGSGTITIGTLATLKSINGWNLKEITIPANASASSVRMINNSDPSNISYIDELRLYPANSQMLTYTFTPLVGMTSETDINSKTTYYEYDLMNRLSVVRDDNKHIVKTICYNYTGLPVPCAVNSIAPCAAPVINSVTHSASLQVTVNYSAPPGTTSCRIEIKDANDVIVGLLNSASCSSPAVVGVSHTGYFYVTVIAYSAQCPGGTPSEVTGIKVMF